MATDFPQSYIVAMGDDIAKNRRQALRHGMIGAIGAIASLKAGLAHARGKATKKQAGYIPRTKGGQSCAMCGYFNDPNDCVLVQGPVSPSGWCSYYVP